MRRYSWPPCVQDRLSERPVRSACTITDRGREAVAVMRALATWDAVAALANFQRIFHLD